MNILKTILLVAQMLSAIAMIGLILMQHGKGADAGAAFGGGAGSASLFGASGGANLISRSTAVLASIFLATTLGLAYFGNLRPATSGSVLEGLPATAPVQTVPSSSDTAPASAPAATGAAQIPAK